VSPDPESAATPANPADRGPCPGCGALRPAAGPPACLPCALATGRDLELVGGILWLGEELYEDDLGIVYEARDRPGRPLHVRFVRPSPGPRATLASALEALAALDHPAIAPFRACDREGDEAYLAWEPASGQASRRDAPAARQIAVALQVLDALEHARGRGIVHGALTAERIRVDARGRVKVLDLGVAAIAGRSADAASDLAALVRALPALAALAHPAIEAALAGAGSAPALRRELAELRVRWLLGGEAAR
jgi:hypothetical protein